MTAIINPATTNATPFKEELTDDEAMPMSAATTTTTVTTKGHSPQPHDNIDTNSNSESYISNSNSDDSDPPPPPPTPPRQEWDLRIRYGSPQVEAYNHPLKHDDVVVVPEFFGEEEDWTIYYQLLNEIKELQNEGVPGTQWKRCPKAVGKHLVCANPMKCAKFKEICTRVCKYFGIKRDETLEFTLNWYKLNDDLQTPRHEEEAYQQDDPPVRNITVAISFGAERELSLEKYEPPPPKDDEENKSSSKNKADSSTAASNSKTPKARLAIPQMNNGVCTIGRNVNIRFEHGITVAEEDEEDGPPPPQPRIGIVLWGVVQTDEEEDNAASPPLLPRPNGKR